MNPAPQWFTFWEGAVCGLVYAAAVVIVLFLCGSRR